MGIKQSTTNATDPNTQIDNTTIDNTTQKTANMFILKEGVQTILYTRQSVLLSHDASFPTVKPRCFVHVHISYKNTVLTLKIVCVQIVGTIIAVLCVYTKHTTQHTRRMLLK